MGTTGTVHIISLWLSCTPPFNEQKNNFSTRLRLLEVVLVGVGEKVFQKQVGKCRSSIRDIDIGSGYVSSSDNVVKPLLNDVPLGHLREVNLLVGGYYTERFLDAKPKGAPSVLVDVAAQ